MSMIRPPAKWYGGKRYLSSWIISLISNEFKCRHGRDNEHIFVETHGGMGSVILNKPPCDVEVFNDIDLRMWNLFNELKINPNKFRRLLTLTPYHQEEFALAKLRSDGTGLEAAVAFYTQLRQSFGGAGVGFSFTKHRARKGMADVVSGWLSSIEENLPLVISRLVEIQHIKNEDALKVIHDFDSVTTCFYCDPTYLHETRTSTGEYGAYEMSEADHHLLLTTLQHVRGRFLLSGYHSELYDRIATNNNWSCHEKKINNHAAGGKTKRIMTEVIWRNF